MSELTQEQIAQVARIVTGIEWAIKEPDSYSNNQIRKKSVIGTTSELWEPAFDSVFVHRSQALAIVEWLVDHIKDDPVIEAEGQKFRVRADWLLECIYNQDITALQAMVLELSEKS